MEILTRELTRLERGALERHFLALQAEDRRLRFGAALQDQGVRDYVARIGFDRDAVFGVFDDELALVGVAHLARAENHAELGISVLGDWRGRGVGSALLDRSHAHARNAFVRTLFMHCLTENAQMLRLARRQRMRIVTTAGEADAYLDLAPPDHATLAGELLAERVGLFDYALKKQLFDARRLSRTLATGQPR
jgi:GNAT superfamily N-acetyltransferase